MEHFDHNKMAAMGERGDSVFHPSVHYTEGLSRLRQLTEQHNAHPDNNAASSSICPFMSNAQL